jgi:hypothetical protein
VISRRTLLEGLGVSLVLPRPAHAIVGQGQRAAIVTSVAQPVIDVIAGQSNMIFGVPFTIANDKGSTEYLQMYSGNEGAANTISPGAQNDPLDNPDPTGQTTPAIGPAVHFYRDWYSPAFHPSKVLFLPCAYGGTPLINTGINTWGVTTATGGASVGSLTTNAIARIKLAKQLWPTAKLIFRFEDVEQDFNGYSTFQNTILSHFRGALHCWLLYVRSQMAAIGYANFPIIIGRPNPWALTIGGAGPNPNYWYPPNMVAADIIIRAVANRFPYVGIDEPDASDLSGLTAVDPFRRGRPDHDGRQILDRLSTGNLEHQFYDLASVGPARLPANIARLLKRLRRWLRRIVALGGRVFKLEDSAGHRPEPPVNQQQALRRSQGGCCVVID